MVSEALNCTPVDLADPENRSRLSLNILVVSFVRVRGEGETFIIVESYTKK